LRDYIHTLRVFLEFSSALNYLQFKKVFLESWSDIFENGRQTKKKNISGSKQS